MSAEFDNFLERNSVSLCLGERQRNFLHKLVDRCRTFICWDGINAVPDVAVAVMVMDAAPAARVEMLINALHENSVVIVPGSENPAFDTLKSRLHAHGSLGADGPDAPHQIWWGSRKPPTVPTGIYRKQDTLFVSAYDDSEAADHAALLSYDLQRLGLEHSVGPAPRSGRNGKPVSKVEIILQHWETACRPVFWIDPRTRLAAHPLLPQAIGCDFAVHRERNGMMTTAGLFFHQTEEASDLLDIWRRLVIAYPDVPDSFLLDQAWTMSCAQRQIATTWLPASYCRRDDATQHDGTAITTSVPSSEEKHPLTHYAVALSSGRRFYRPQAPEAHLIVRDEAGRNGLVTVIIRDTLAASACDVRGSIAAAAAAFTSDSAGFSQMEIVLCGWAEDIQAVLQIEDHSWVLMTDPTRRLNKDAFRSLARSIRSNRRGSIRATSAPAFEITDSRSLSTIHLHDDQHIRRNRQSRILFRHPETIALPPTLN